MGIISDLLGTSKTSFKIGKVTFDASAVANNRTLTIPGVTSTLAVLGLAQTFTATQSFGSIIPNGLVDISGASGGQIKFPATQNASANVNTLDDYEEGTWTATFATGFLTQPTVTMNYTKIGNLFCINGSLQIGSAVTADGNPITITGVPLAPAGGAVVMQVAAPQRVAFTSGNVVVWRLDSTTLSLVDIATASATYNGIISSSVANTPFMGSIFMTFAV